MERSLAGGLRASPGRCDGPYRLCPYWRHLRRLARAPIGMAAGYCAGIVVAPPEDFGARILRMPRVVCCRCPVAKIFWSQM